MKEYELEANGRKFTVQLDDDTAKQMNLTPVNREKARPPADKARKPANKAAEPVDVQHSDTEA